MTDPALSALKTVAVIAALALGGYFLFRELGTARALRVLGFEVTTVSTAPDSQCNRARERQTQDEAIVCIPDREWLRRYRKACSAGKSDGLVYIDQSGTLVDAGACAEGTPA